jgi:hypothetical protein
MLRVRKGELSTFPWYMQTDGVKAFWHGLYGTLYDLWLIYYGLCDGTVSFRVQDLIKRAASRVCMCVRKYLSSVSSFTDEPWRGRGIRLRTLNRLLGAAQCEPTFCIVIQVLPNNRELWVLVKKAETMRSEEQDAWKGIPTHIHISLQIVSLVDWWRTRQFERVQTHSNWFTFPEDFENLEPDPWSGSGGTPGLWTRLGSSVRFGPVRTIMVNRTLPSLRLREREAYYWYKKLCGVRRNGVAQSRHTTEWLT